MSAALQESDYTVSVMVTGSGAVRTILEISSDEDSRDRIMMTTYGRGTLSREASIGSVAERVIDAANCPVFLFQSKQITMAGNTMTLLDNVTSYFDEAAKLTNNPEQRVAVARGAEEIDIVNSGLEETMVNAYQQIH